MWGYMDDLQVVNTLFQCIRETRQEEHGIDNDLKVVVEAESHLDISPELGRGSER